MAADNPTHLPLRPALLVGGASAALIAGTGALWAFYGTSVFFEILRAGWAACF